MVPGLSLESRLGHTPDTGPRSSPVNLYEIVFSGQLVPGAQLERVQANLAKVFQADAQRLALLFSGRRLVLKNNLDAPRQRNTAPPWSLPGRWFMCWT